MIERMLDKLYEDKDALEKIRTFYTEKRASLIPPEVTKLIDEIDAEYLPFIDAAQTDLTALENSIKAAVIETGKTAKGQHISAIYNSGRVSWDTKALDGYAVAHPEIAPLRKVGAPYVTIRE